MTITTAFPSDQYAHVIVVGNEKGGAGKSTTAVHIMASLLALGYNVATLDVDSRQQSFSHYLANRQHAIATHNLPLLLPMHQVIESSRNPHTEEAAAEETERFTHALATVFYTHDFIVIDTPGSNSFLSQLAHSYADTLITPINDSFVDLDVLAHVEPTTHKIIGPGIYSEMVWKQKMMRAQRDKRSMQWIVMRNRLSHVDAKNKRYMTDILDKLAQRIGFRHAPGFSERVIFRELFLQGMTLLDLLQHNSQVNLTLSHVAARQELRDFLQFLQIESLQDMLLDTNATVSDETSSVYA